MWTHDERVKDEQESAEPPSRSARRRWPDRPRLAVTNFSGNAVATLLVGNWTKTVDNDKVDGVPRGDDPFDEVTMLDEKKEEKQQDSAEAPELQSRAPDV